MMKTRSLGKLFGVELKIHGTFLILLAFLALSGLFQGGMIHAVMSLTLSVVVFSVIVLHEFGHILAAKKFGIKTKDVILSPLGGMARLEKLPATPAQEIAVAAAGPAVNLFLAAAAFLALQLPNLQSVLAPTTFFGALLSWFITINVVLLVFNLLPALPMDGGRILRAFLSKKHGHVKATEKAAKVARWTALLMAIYAVFNGQFVLLFIAGFVFVMSWMEVFQAKVRQSQQNPAFQVFQAFQQAQQRQSAAPSQVVDQNGNAVVEGNWRVKDVRWSDET